jgi:hypothetical protein
VLLLTVGALVGCDAGDGTSVVACTVPPDAPAGPVTVQTDCAAYAPGAALDLLVRNDAERAVEYGPCGVALERREGEAWVEAGPLCQFERPESEAGDIIVLCCQAFGITLPPHSEDSMRFYLAPDLRPSTYRVQVNAGLDGAGQDGARRDTLVHSNAFEIQ